MRSAWLALAILLSGCVLPAGGPCYKIAQTGSWTEPGIWGLLAARRDNGWHSEPLPQTPALDVSVTAAWWNGTGHLTSVARRTEDVHFHAFFGRSDGRSFWAMEVPEDWTEDELKSAADQFLREAGAANTDQRSAWVSSLGLDECTQEQRIQGGVPCTAKSCSRHWERCGYSTYWAGPLDLALPLGAWNLQPELDTAGHRVLRGTGTATSWSISVDLPTLRHPMPRPQPDVFVDSGDRVTAGYAEGQPVHNSTLANEPWTVVDGWWRANATAAFASLGLPPPTFQEEKLEPRSYCGD